MGINNDQHDTSVHDLPLDEPTRHALAELDERVERTKISRDAWTLIIGGFAAVALLVSVVAFGAGLRAIDESEQSAKGATAVGPPVAVSLEEFKISPASIEAPVGSTLEITNNGTQEHDFAIDGTDLSTPGIAAGDTETLDISSLDPGTYKVFCTIPGHEPAGMVAELTVTTGAGATNGAAAAAADGADPAATPANHEQHDPSMSAQQMDLMMAKRTHAFPAETKGRGARPLKPKVLPDGTKQFELTASVVDWEVEPGKVVDGWAYNGQIPGPTIHVNTGDKVRVVLRNELPESTSIHFHGILVPNAMDGVPDVTQPPVKPGKKFVYEFVARETGVGMYHSHHNSAKQVSNGLAGTFIVDQLPMPDGKPIDVEYPMMLNDSGTIGLSLNGKSFPATEPLNVNRGDRVLVHYLNAGAMAHPMHLHGVHATVVAKDGVPLPAPYKADTVNVAPGERYSLLIEATEPGTWVWHCHILTHAEAETGMFGMVTALTVKPR